MVLCGTNGSFTISAAARRPRTSISKRVPGAAWAGGPALTHAGSNTMWFAVAWLAPRKDFAVLVACNQANDKASNDAVLALVADYFKGE